LIDGSYGEGGGQLLRTALSLSVILQRPFQIFNLRAKRPKPGLRPQHLACVKACKVLSLAETKGDELNSQELTFIPQRRPPRGHYTFDIGTAGATSLLFQTLLFPLALSEGGELTLIGGTHVPMAPPYHYLELVYLPMISLFGFRVRLSLKKVGFYPKGGGEIRAHLERVEFWNLPQFERGFNPERLFLLSLISEDLPQPILERQLKGAQEVLATRGLQAEDLLEKVKSASPGTMLFLYAEDKNKRAGFTSLGKKGLPAEEVGKRAAFSFLEFLQSQAQFEEHLGDQLLLPASLALLKVHEKAFSFEVSKITKHLLTQAFVISQFLPKIKIKILGEENQKGEVILERTGRT